jgi:hypothetical protein
MNTSTKAALPPPSIGSALDGGLGYQDLFDPSANTYVLVGPIPKANKGDRVTVFWDGEDVKTYDIMEADLGKTFPVPVPNAKIIAADNGEKVLTYAVHYNQGGGDDFSEPPVIITVKRIVPGGLDPHPETPHNENLGPLIISPNPVPPDATEVTVDVPLWKNPAKNDQAVVSWNGAMFFPALLPDAPFPQTVRVTLTAMDLITAGVGPKVPVTWGVHDIVANWSFWAEAVEVDVRVEDPGLLVAPRVGSKEKPWTQIDLAALAGNALDVFTPNYQDATKDDLVVVHAHGIALDGSKVTFDSEPQRTEQPEFGMTFKVPNAKVAELAGGEVRIWYSVTGKGESHSVWLKVTGATQADYPAPWVKEAEDSDGDDIADWLDPAKVKPLAHVTIAYPTMARDDVVTLILEGTNAGGAPVRLSYPQKQVGAPAPINATVPQDDILRFLNGQMNVYYSVRAFSRRPTFLSALHGEAESERLTLRVRPSDVTEPHPAPVIKDNRGNVIVKNGSIGVDVAYADAQASYANPAIGDEIIYSWVGSMSTQTELYRVADPAVMPTDRAERAFLDKNMGAYVYVSYGVKRAGLDPVEPSEVINVWDTRYSTEDFESAPVRDFKPDQTLKLATMEVSDSQWGFSVLPNAGSLHPSRCVAMGGHSTMTFAFTRSLSEIRLDIRPGQGAEKTGLIEAWDASGARLAYKEILADSSWTSVTISYWTRAIASITYKSTNNGGVFDNFVLIE